MSAPTIAPAATAETLAALLAERLGPVTGLRRLSGGASRETWAFDAAGRELILRRDPPHTPDPVAMAREAALLVAAAEAGVPVPAVVEHGPDLAGTPYMVMERLRGETIPRRLLRDERFAAVRPGLARELGRILAHLHELPPDAVPDLPALDPLQEMTDWYAGFEEPRPAVELALRWLADNRPAEAGRPTIVHADFRNGNLLIDEDGVRGVLDWELSHAGDPWEDLGWLCVKAWRFGSPLAAGGFGTREELLAGYAEGGGTPPSPETLRWWEVFGTLRWTVLCRHQAERFLSGADDNVEFAVLGRRVCEQEHDLLLSLGLTEPVTVADPLDVPGEPASVGPHDRPGAAALIDAVRHYLTTAEVADERLRFHNRVGAAALRIVQRELLLGAEHAAAHTARLGSFGCADDAEFAVGIREGRFDDRWHEVVTAVAASVVDKLIVANPRHLATPA
ncbi:aminoglycoside phosphotransferase (APT) family kinase protein [Actinocorallia herbida]|uniref:Aminoglycoside phosphotransferase (APT) family kinase protein n=1 Tax=Actinocorallia herbida TaxID=58109 RepID=A0A3N1DBF1_9ACTN|nr:phosphotransferase family protein [Actinocorallia herbida]ROO90851.1 aminoglycoside phosphotransferase (APT) family kinase protein [Actinocorallia herbida]